MAFVSDIALDEEQDLTFRNGDFDTNPSDDQHIYDLVQGFLAWLKEFPLTGVGIGRYINSSGMETEIKAKMQTNLTGDGYFVKGITKNGEQWQINAERNG